MSNSDLSPVAPQGERNPPQIRPVWCPRTGGSRQTWSPAGHCNHPLSRSSQTLLYHRISEWMVKLVGWRLCSPFSLWTSLAHGFFLLMLRHASTLKRKSSSSVMDGLQRRRSRRIQPDIPYTLVFIIKYEVAM